MTTKSLFDLTKEALEIRNEIMALDGEMSEDLETRLAISQEQLEEKSTGYALIIKELEHTEAAHDAEIEYHKRRKAQIVKKRERLIELISSAMIEFGITKVENPRVNLSFRKSTSTEIIDEASIPSEYIKTKIVDSIDKTAIKKALQDGKAVLGAQLVEKQNLQIK